MRRSLGPDDSETACETQQTDPWPTTAALLRARMTVILGRSQLLQRKIRSGQVWHATEYMDGLTEIAEAVQQMEAHLRQAETEES